MNLNIFSGAHWSFVYLVSRTVYSDQSHLLKLRCVIPLLRLKCKPDRGLSTRLYMIGRCPCGLHRSPLTLLWPLGPQGGKLVAPQGPPPPQGLYMGCLLCQITICKVFLRSATARPSLSCLSRGLAPPRTFLAHLKTSCIEDVKLLV